MNCITFTKINTIKINSLSTKNRTKLDYKKLRLADNYDYPSDEEQKEKQEEKQEETKTDMNEISKYIAEEEKDINYDLFKNHFYYQTPSALLKDLYKTNDKDKNSKLVSVINSGLKDFKKKLRKIN